MTEETQTTNELQIVIDQNGLEAETRIALKNAFDPFYIQASEWKSKALALTVTDASQIKEMVDAREARLVLKGIRIDVEKTRKTLKEDSLRKGKAIDTIANVLKDLITPIEDHLEKQEKFVEIQEDNRKAELKLTRTRELQAITWEGIALVNPDFYALAEMSEDEYQGILASARYTLQKKQEDKAKAEQDKKDAEAAAETKRIADEAARKKLEEENKKLKAQARDLKTELKSTTEVLKETKTELQQEKKAFTGFATGLGSSGSRTEVTEEKIKIGSDLFTPKKDTGENEKQDVAYFIKLISDIRGIRTAIPAMTTPKGKSLSGNIQILLKKVEDYGGQFIDVKNAKITI